MPDFEAMSDADLRAFKRDAALQIRELRESARQAQMVLEAKRAHQDEKWRRAAEAARDLGPPADERHDALTRHFFEMPDDEMDAAIEKALEGRRSLSREERRQMAREGTDPLSAYIVAPVTGAAAKVTTPGPSNN